MLEKATQVEEMRNLTLVRGLMQGGGFYWCYVAVKPSMLLKFQREVSNKYNIQNFVKDGYGEVVVSGRGRNPPKEVTELLVERLGVNFTDLDGLTPEIARDKIMSLTQSQQEKQ